MADVARPDAGADQQAIDRLVVEVERLRGDLAAARANCAVQEERLRALDDLVREMLLRHATSLGETGGREAAAVAPPGMAAERGLAELAAVHERQTALMADLRHRVRNILTVVRSVFSRTVEAGGSTDELADHFRGRLDSIARVQMLVLQSGSGSIDLESLIRDELLMVGAGDGPSITIDGPDVELSPKAGESLGLAVHELVTNAIKYGALKQKGSKLKITWRINISERGSRQLVFTWDEQDVPTVELRPARKGFGHELITEALPYRLGAETGLYFRGGGVCCSISMPLPE